MISDRGVQKKGIRHTVQEPSNSLMSLTTRQWIGTNVLFALDETFFFCQFIVILIEQALFFHMDDGKGVYSLDKCNNRTYQCIIHVRQVIREQRHRRLHIPKPQINVNGYHTWPRQHRCWRIGD